MSKLQALRLIRGSSIDVMCVVDEKDTQAVQDAMRTLARAARTPVAFSLVDVATGAPLRRFASGQDAPGRKGAVR